mgnify:FL=1
METKIILIRHAECVGNISNRLSGITDFELTDNGKRQAQKLAKELRNKNIDVIYSSPLRRAMDTAKYIARNNNIKIINKDERLIEINYGVCDGMSWNKIDNKYPLVRKLWKEMYKYPILIPGQEEFIDVSKRMNEAIKDISNKNQGKTICIVSHGIAIQAFVSFYYNDITKKIGEIQQLKNAEYIEFII